MQREGLTNSHNRRMNDKVNGVGRDGKTDCFVSRRLTLALFLLENLFWTFCLKRKEIIINYNYKGGGINFKKELWIGRKIMGLPTFYFKETKSERSNYTQIINITTTLSHK